MIATPFVFNTDLSKEKKERRIDDTEYKIDDDVDNDWATNFHPRWRQEILMSPMFNKQNEFNISLLPSKR